MNKHLFWLTIGIIINEKIGFAQPKELYMNKHLFWLTIGIIINEKMVLLNQKNYI